MDHYRARLISDLFNACTKALRILAANAYGSLENIASCVEEERGRLELWGDGFNVYEGDLDQLLESSSHLKGATMVLLVCIASTAIKRIFPTKILDLLVVLSPLDLIQAFPNQTRDISNLIENTKRLVPEATEYIDQNSDDTNAEISDTVDEVKEFNDDLYGLVPFLRSIKANIQSEREPKNADTRTQAPISRISEFQRPKNPKSLRIEAQFYQKNIFDKFPKANPDLTAVMAEINCLRHERIRHIINNGGNSGEPAPAAKDAEDALPVSEGHTTTTSPTLFQPPPMLSRALSPTPSFVSSIYRSIYAQFPKPPDKLGSGRPFGCTICSQILPNTDKNQWRYSYL